MPICGGHSHHERIFPWNSKHPAGNGLVKAIWTPILETDPLRKIFNFGHGGRFPSQHGSYCFYDAERTDGSKLEAAFLCDEDGNFQTISAPASKEFKPSLWRVKRNTRTDAGENARQVMNMLDAPFYSRSMVETYIHKERVTGIHEALDMRRFNQHLIKAMIAMRTPRIPAWLTPAKA